LESVRGLHESASLTLHDGLATTCGPDPDSWCFLMATDDVRHVTDEAQRTTGFASARPSFETTTAVP
jgi:hypothetical protein